MDQTIENQRAELSKLYKIDREFSDNGISGTTKAADRDGFRAMVDYAREGDTLIAVDIDRLGRDAIDVQQTIAYLKVRKVNVIIHRLGVDLNSDAGELLVTIMSKIAEMERNKMLERQRAGIERAKAEGKYRGRQADIDPGLVVEARKTMSIAKTADHLGISIASVKRLQKQEKDRLAKLAS